MRLVCRADTPTLDAYIEQRTDQQVVFAIGGRTCRIASKLVASHQTLYFHIEELGGEVLNAIVDTVHRHEFSHCPERELLQTFVPLSHGHELTQAQTTSLSTYTIEHAVIREPSIESVTAAIQKLGTELQDVAFRVGADGPHCFQEGAVVRFDRIAFRTLVETYLKGRKLADLHEDQAMSHLFCELDLIRSLRLSPPQDALSGPLSRERALDDRKPSTSHYQSVRSSRRFRRVSRVCSQSEVDLLRICHGDQAQFERLVCHEQERDPTLSRQEAIEDALYRYRRDNR